MPCFTCHSVLIFVVYNVIYRFKVALDYNLLITFDVWDKIKGLIKDFTYAQLIAAAIKTKKTNQYTNLAILAFKKHL